jgi:hypothetical protein
MNARVTTTTEVVASPPSSLAPPEGQLFALGVTQRGPVDRAVRVNGLAAYTATFGGRAGGSDTYDLLEMAFKEGLGSAWVARMSGPAALPASKALGALTVTATSPGAWANTVSVGWVQADSAVTVDGVSYPGADVATINSKLLLDNAPVRVSGTLPSGGDVLAGALSGGTDDASNAVLADLLELFDGAMGDGAVTVVGKSAADVQTALAAHCQANNRHGLIPAVAGSSLAEALVELVSVTDPTLNLLWPTVTAGLKTYSPVGLAAGARARAMASGNPVAAPFAPAYGVAQFADGVTTNITDAQWRTANAAGLSVIRAPLGQVQLAGWRTVAPPDNKPTMQGAHYRDLINRVAAGCDQVCHDWRGETVNGPLSLSALTGRLTGFMESISQAFTPGANDPGYTIDAGPGVNTPAQIATGVVLVNVGFRAAGTAEFFEISIKAADPAGNL